MERVSVIVPSEMAQLSEFDKDGNLVIPKGWELYKVATPEEKIIALQNEIKKISETLLSDSEPDEKELLEYARLTHPFYQNRMNVEMQIENLNAQIEALK